MKGYATVLYTTAILDLPSLQEQPKSSRKLEVVKWWP